MHMVKTTNDKEKEIAGANIRRLCEEQNISIRQLAKDLEMNRSWLHDIIEGRANVTFDMLARIASYLGTTVRDLLTERKREKRELARK